MANPKISFGQLEQAIMKLAWDRGRVTVRQVLERLPGHRQVAYTTVMTVMNRLVEQECLKRHRTSSGAFTYRPLRSRSATAAAAARHSLQSLIQLYGEVGLAQFLNQLDRIPESKLQRLRRQLRQRKPE
jgi:predicted transcriptional regulator